MSTFNVMQAIRIRAATALKVAAIAAVLSCAAPLVGNTAPVSAQIVPWPEMVVQVGKLRICLFICWKPGYCCSWITQL